MTINWKNTFIEAEYKNEQEHCLQKIYINLSNLTHYEYDKEDNCSFLHFQSGKNIIIKDNLVDLVNNQLK